jgi:hypothetical protein
MRPLKFRRPSPAMLVAFAALLVGGWRLAVGGTSYAAITLPANSVGTKQIGPAGPQGRRVPKDRRGRRVTPGP